MARPYRDSDPTALRQVRNLLDEIRSASPSLTRASDQIEVICRAYMVPDIEDRGLKLGLRQTAARMFNLLHARNGNPVTRDALLDVGVHQGDGEPDIKIVDIQICKLRKALRGTSYEGKIETVYGIGYRLAA